MTLQIGKADLDRKLKQAQGFLEKGEQVQVQVQLRGRQQAHPERAVEFLHEISESHLSECGKPSNEPRPGRLSITFNPKKR